MVIFSINIDEYTIKINYSSISDSSKHSISIDTLMIQYSIDGFNLSNDTFKQYNLLQIKL